MFPVDGKRELSRVVVRVLWSTKCRHMDVMRISQRVCRRPNAARLASALVEAADAEVELGRRSFQIVVRIWWSTN